MSRSIASTLLLALLACQPGAIPADDPPPAGSKAEAARAAKAAELTKAEAALYRLDLEGGEKGSASLHPDALLQWSNPVVGSIHGSVYVWTDRGCPVAIASIYRWFSPNNHLGAEFHALTPKLTSAERDGQPAWSPGNAPIERKPVPGAPRPAETPAARLRQLRALAGEFNANETLRSGAVRELRLLTQPIFRYQSTDPDVLDGGLFALVLGTDPDIVLMIEARKTKAGTEWQYAAARLNSLGLTLNHKGREAWTAPMITWQQAADHKKPYTYFQFDQEPYTVPDEPRE